MLQQHTHQFQIVVILAVVFISVIEQAFTMPPNSNKGHDSDGSRCNGVVCTADPGNCHSTYDRGDRCCPVWHCKNRNGGEYEAYGRSSGGGGNFQSQNSWGTGGQGPGPVMQPMNMGQFQMPTMPQLPIPTFPFTPFPGFLMGR